MLYLFLKILNNLDYVNLLTRLAGIHLLGILYVSETK